ncbi:MAG: Gfo/Idh/MocA family protein [Chthoniobacterales bacterium]
MSQLHSDIGILKDAELVVASKRPQSTTKRLRLGFIGAGWWATTNHMPLLRARKDVEFVSVCGLDRDLNLRLQQDFGFHHTTADYRELLDQNLDAVIVSSPNSLHAIHAGEALKRGCHVMVEKPMTVHASETRELVELARANSRHLIVPYGWHYRPLSQEARRLMLDVGVGEIEMILCHLGSPGKNLFTGRSFDHAEGSYVGPDLGTYTDPRMGGGFGQGQLSHALALMIWLTDVRPQSVFARMHPAGGAADLHDSLSVQFAGGAIGSVSGTATVPDGRPFQLDIRVFGSEGMLLYDVERERAELHMHDGRSFVVPFQPGDGAYRCDLPPHQFVELALGLTTENRASGELALASVEILDAAYRSAASGRDEAVNA